MSRVGKYPVEVPNGVDISIVEGLVTAKGKNGEQKVAITDYVTVSMAENMVSVEPVNQSKKARQHWGMVRAMISNAVLGASEGFVKRLEVNGVGYRAQVQGSTLKLQLGFSHDVNFPIPSDVKIAIEGDRGNIIAVSGADKQRVGQIASEIRGYRPPEPYKGKGLRYTDETILRKEGKKK